MSWLLSPKVWCYIIAGLLYPALYIYGDYHGHVAEKNSYYLQTNAGAQAANKDNTKQAEKAIVDEGKQAVEISQLDNSKQQVKDKVNELAKDNPCGTTKLSADELQYINGLIEASNTK